ncbi:uncharacterized protein [Mycetomoellerius zeteki]|uniref:uncharacterized protein isoform X1 n=1 Tax=Mycetomoellerius zeteki TaxID=64791 RepID=UPI00084EB827|nr:PREDICTED: uncharacterized protein LOC108722826 isoform X1 [Trachymyrmex zeteki]
MEGRVSCGSSAIAAAAAVATAAATAGIEVKGIAGAWSTQKGRQSPPSSPLSSRRLDSGSGAAAAFFNPVVAAAATSQRCAAVKGAVAVDTAAPRPQCIYKDRPLITETSKEDAMEPETKEEDERRSTTPSPEVCLRRSKRYNEDGSSEEEAKQNSTSLPSHRLPSLYRGTWPIRRDVWANQQIGFPTQQSTSLPAHNDVASVISFSSSSNSAGLEGNSTELQGHRRLDAKVDVVYNLLGMLEKNGRDDMSTTLLSMSTSIDSCLVMRQSGCLPLLVQLIHAPGQNPDTRDRAMQALHNVVHAKSDERAGRREARVLRFLEQLRDYCQNLRMSLEQDQLTDDLERGHPATTIAALMKLSFDEAHRHAMCQLGGLHAVAELIEMDHLVHGSESDDQNCITLRRYAGMALTNLTFGDGNNKALLCSFKEFMKALVSQLKSPSDDLRQVTASVLRNLSWRADSSSKQTLREVGAVTGLMKAAMEGRKESTLKSILSALWNLSAHCSTNKVDICVVDGALAFLVDMLSYKAPSKTLAIVENAGGILRNVSSHVAVREDYRTIVRERGCLQVLLQQLKSPSLTVVSNACGALWNLSARCSQDQRLLWDLGAVPMLRSLVHSKHKMISMGSSAALKNLLSARPGCNNLVHLDSTARGLGLSTLPSLVARRQRALEQEIDQSLAETCDNIEPSTSPTNKNEKFTFKLDHSFLGVNAHRLRSYQLHGQPNTSAVKCNGVARSESRDSMRSVTSTHSDTMFERVNRHVLNGISPTESQVKQQSSSLHSAVGFGNNGVCGDVHPRTTSSERKYTLRYKNAIPEQLKPSDVFGSTLNKLKCTNSTISWAAVPNQEPSQISLHSSIENNISLIDQSMSSLSKAGSQSSVSEEVEATVRIKLDYRTTTDAIVDNSKLTSDLSDVPSMKENARKVLLRKHDTLNSVQKAISSATIIQSPDDNLFGDYAETDLDQPTDYSLRYGEQTIDDEKQSDFFSGNDQGLQHEDTIKTYYTEGTPRASLNSSRATSASDLQDDSRIKNLSKKLPERYKASHVDSHGECKAPSLMNVPKLNDFAKSETELNLRDVTRLTDDESANHSLPYLEDQDKQKDNREDAIVQSHSSVRTTPISMILGNSEYNDDRNGESSSRINSLDSKPNKVNKNLPLSDIELSADSTSLKISNNDSGYQVSDGDEDDEDLLAACINIGMQNNRHRHSFIGNNLEKLPRLENNLTRYQTSLALNQVEHKGTVMSDSSSFNVKYVEPRGTTAENILAEKNREDKKDNNGKLSKKNLQLEIVTVFCSQITTNMDNIHNEKSNNTTTMKTVNGNNLSNNFSEEAISILQTSNSSLDKNVPNDFVITDEPGRDQNSSIRADEAIIDVQLTDIPSMKQSKDSESSESIDSVEQSEHALLELCIQSGIKSEGNITLNQSNADYVKSQLKLYNKQIDIIKGRNNDEIEIKDNRNGKSETTFEIMRTLDVLHRDCAEKHTKEETYRRQRDPDAMIASLDRLTATLVQQTEAIRERDSGTMKQSVTCDTWNEDSPNDISFPSISMSAPLVASFNSDAQENQRTTISENTEQINMTESKIIQREAIKLAEAVDAEINNQNELETTSLISIDLEAIKPPSSMGSLLSLTASYAGTADNTEMFINRDRCYSTSLPPAPMRNFNDSRNVRKKSLPVGVVAKRALGQGQSHTTSLENLLNECTNSHLENVKPPSMMDELPDVGDMENSMLSVASITSEIADSKEQESHNLTGSDPAVFEMLKPVANVLSMTCMHYVEGMQNSTSNSLSECLENINPPSLFNEVTEMDESTMEATTDIMCSDTLCIDMELHTDEVVHSIVAEVIDEAENDTDEAVTPISSEYCVSSSAESTPKKRSHSKSYLTPKQKRNLAKERYKTYTIAAEIIKKEEEERRRQDDIVNDAGNRIPRRKCSPFSKLTPKQRRQENRARFQTQVLENPFPDLNVVQTKEETTHKMTIEDTVEKQEVISSVKSSIPMLTKLPVCKALRRKHGDSQENRERYRTRTLNDSETMFKEMECNSASNQASITGIMEEGQASAQEYVREEIQSMLEQNTTIVLNTLNESNKANDSTADDILRCETTLALNDPESNHNLRMHFVNGLSKKLTSTQYDNDAQTPVANIDNEELEGEHIEVAYENLGLANPVDSGSDEESNCADKGQEPRETKRARIIKPPTLGRDPSMDSTGTDKSEPESPKTIRGRRKALYSNPITRKPTPQSSPLKQVNSVSGIPIGRSNTSPIVRATRAITLRKNNNSTMVATKDSPKSNTSPKRTSLSVDVEKKTRNLATVSKRASVPQRGSMLIFTKPTKRHSTPSACSSNYQNDSKPSEVPIKLLERQGTFTKDEPEVDNAPTVHSASSSPIKTKIAKPIRGVSSKIYSAAGKSKLSVKTQQEYQPKIMVNSSEKMQSSKGLLTVPKKISSGKIGVLTKVLNGNVLQNDKTVRKINPLGQQSNSNSSIISNSPMNVQNRKLAKEATSKIANLWKKVEENKNKQRFEKPDTRQWIRPTNSATEVNVATAGTFNNPPAYRLFRSSTFEGISQENGSNGEISSYKSKSNRQPVLGTQIECDGLKYRNSCDFTGMNAYEAPCKIPVKSSVQETYKREITQLSDILVIMKKQPSADLAAEADLTKRISRLGSFIRVDPMTTAEDSSSGVRMPTSAIVSLFNYNPNSDIPSQAAKIRSNEEQGKLETIDCYTHTEIATGSTRVTTV